MALKFLRHDCYGIVHDMFKIEILEAITRQQNQLSEASGAHVFGLTDTFHLSGTNGTHEYIVL